jgi:hypothetical protein
MCSADTPDQLLPPAVCMAGAIHADLLLGNMRPFGWWHGALAWRHAQEHELTVSYKMVGVDRALGLAGDAPAGDAASWGGAAAAHERARESVFLPLSEVAGLMQATPSQVRRCPDVTCAELCAQHRWCSIGKREHGSVILQHSTPAPPPPAPGRTIAPRPHAAPHSLASSLLMVCARNLQRSPVIFTARMLLISLLTAWSDIY